jgi:protein Mpv17
MSLPAPAASPAMSMFWQTVRRSTTPSGGLVLKASLRPIAPRVTAQAAGGAARAAPARLSGAASRAAMAGAAAVRGGAAAGSGSGSGGARASSVWRRAWALYTGALARRPIATNMATAGVLSFTADMVAQTIESSRAADAGEEPGAYSVKRAVSTAGFNVALAPFLFGWFRALDRVFPAKNTMAVLAGKIFIHQATCSTVCNAAFFAWVIATRGDGPKDVTLTEQWKAKVKADLVDTQIRAWTFWPAANFVSFAFVPLALRLPYLNMGAMAWSTYLSLQGYKKQPAPASEVVIEDVTNAADPLAVPSLA